MKSPGVEEHLDEVHCLWALCSHPCCWESGRRVAEGVYRRAVRVPSERGSNAGVTAAVGSPSLTLVDVCEWSSLRSGRRSPSGIPPPRRAARPRTTDASLPAISSAAAKPHPGGNHTRPGADNAAHISPLIGWPSGSGSLTMWVPNPRYVPQRLNRCPNEHAASLGCSVTELICLPAARTLNTQTATRKRAKKKTKRVRFQLPVSPRSSRSNQWAESGSPGRVKGRTGDRVASVEDPEHPRELRVSPVRNKPAVCPSVREKTVGRSNRDAAALRYKLDSKTGKEVVDWDSLRGQSYLWKKHNVPPEHVGPPGGARGARESVGSPPVSKPGSDGTLQSRQSADTSPSRVSSRDVGLIITGAM